MNREELLKLPPFEILDDDTLISAADLVKGDIIVAVDRSYTYASMPDARYVGTSPSGRRMPWRMNTLGNVVFGPGVLVEHQLHGHKVWIRRRQSTVPLTGPSLSEMSEEQLADLAARVDEMLKARAEKVEKRWTLAREIANQRYRKEYPHARIQVAPKWVVEAVEDALRTEDPSK